MNKIRGWIRLWVFSLCPACNSDAPKIDHCLVCGGLRSHSVTIKWPWSKTVRTGMWARFRYIYDNRPQDLFEGMKPKKRKANYGGR
jgi:hypothetical protein